MNCDQAFDVMTSSERESDRDLNAHLARCPRCREMQQTLEPALGMFRGDEYSIDSPSWSPALDGNEIATQAARRLTSSPPISRRPAGHLWGYTASLLIGAGLLWCSFAMNPSSSALPEMYRNDTACQMNRYPTGTTGRQMTQSCLACHAVASPE